MIVYIRDFKSSKKFEPVPLEVTLAENWLKSTDSPLFIFAKSLDNKVIEEKIEFILFRTLPFLCRNRGLFQRNSQHNKFLYYLVIREARIT